MAKVKLCGVLTGVRGTFVDDNKINATGKHGVRVNPSGTLSLVQYGKRDMVKHPATQKETVQRGIFAEAAGIRAMILADPGLKSTWLNKFQADKTTNCCTLNGYIMQNALKGRISEEGQPLA